MSSYLNRIFQKAQRYVFDGAPYQYLMSRGLTDDQIDMLGIGYIPETEWPPYIDTEDATEDELHYWERSNRGSRLKGKLLFPVTNALGAIRALQVRSPDPNIKDYWKFYSLQADVDAVFYGTSSAMEHIWDKRTVVLVEGIFDLPPVQRVFPYTLCLGTATVTDRQMKFLNRYVDRVKIMADNDKQGRKFFSRFYQKHKRNFKSVEKIQYAGEDPADSWARLGEDNFRKQFNSEFLSALMD